MGDKKKGKEKKKSDQFSDEVKRLNRVSGQIEGIGKMLGEGRKLKEVLSQFKAVHSALRSVEQRVFRIYVENAMDALAKSDKKKDREAQIEALETLFKQYE
jgi:CsoR family transcriptional regulator, copper-sensing transcriptional repressor